MVVPDRSLQGEKEIQMTKLLRVPEAADLLNMSQKTIWAMIYRHDIEVVRINRSVRIPLGAIVQLVERGTVPAARR
jgi:excisionase family DNA binding protein